MESLKSKSDEWLIAVCWSFLVWSFYDKVTRRMETNIFGIAK